jgi:hypothetical protein
METTDDVVKILSKRELRLNIPQIPELLIDNTDRNRTSPFAFTGNRFEFRAVGSEANCASAMIALNTAMAEQLVIFKQEVDSLIENGMTKEDALVSVLRKYIKYSKPIRFDGNGYSEEWKQEAAGRGLDCESSAPVVFDRYLDPACIDMFARMEVMTETELKARNEIKWEMYTKKVQIEARVLGDLALNHIVPTVMKYQSSLLDNVIKMETVLGKEEGDNLSAENIATVKEIAMRVAEIKRLVNEEPEVRGAYDLNLFNYGPDKYYGSVHMELPDTMTVDEVDVLTRKIQLKVYQETGVILTGIGVYSYNTSNDEAAEIRNTVQHTILSHDWALQLHGFYADTEAKSMRFDVVLSFDVDKADAVGIMSQEVQALYPDYHIMILPDVDVVDLA